MQGNKFCNYGEVKAFKASKSTKFLECKRKSLDLKYIKNILVLVLYYFVQQGLFSCLCPQAL